MISQVLLRLLVVQEPRFDHHWPRGCFRRGVDMWAEWLENDSARVKMPRWWEAEAGAPTFTENPQCEKPRAALETDVPVF